MDGLRTDVRLAFRRLWADRDFTAVALATLVLGIGATSSIFTLVDHGLLRPLPFRDPDRLVAVWGVETGSGISRGTTSYPDLLDFQRGATQNLEALAGVRRTEATLSAPSTEPARLDVGWATRELFDVLGVRPLIGRAFGAEDDRPGAAPTVILSEGLWRTRWAGRADVIGQTVMLDGAPHEVIGVMPGSFRYPAGASLWVPVGRQLRMEHRGVHVLRVVGRLKPGVTIEQASEELAAVAARLQREYPDENAGRTARLEPLHDAVVGPARAGLELLMGAVALLLLVTCANLAGLLLARGTRRARDMAVAKSLGASRVRLVRQALVETSLLAAAGGAAGLAVAWWTVPVLAKLGAAQLPALAADVHVDGRVIGLALLASTLTSLAFGVLPALVVTRLEAGAVLREEGARTAGSRSRHRLRQGLILAQTAVAVVLVCGAGLLLKSLWRLGAVQPGFRTQGVLTAELPLPESRYVKWTSWRDFYDTLAARLAARPGVDAVAVASQQPFDAGWGGRFTIEGRPPFPPGQEPEPAIRVVSPGYLETTGITLLRGRALDARDRTGAPGAVLINEAMAARFFPGEDPIGQRLGRRWWDEEMPQSWEIVGVVGNVRTGSLADAPEEAVYYPTGQLAFSTMTVLVRTSRDPAALVPELTRTVRELDPELAMGEVATMEQVMAEGLGERRFQAALLVVFGALALLLAGVGLYGVLSWSVAQRSREIAVRIALGAVPRDVLALVGAQALRLAGAGLAIGVVAALAGSRLLTSSLYEVSPSDPATLAAVVVVVAVAAVAASTVPVRRALRIAPASALRDE